MIVAEHFGFVGGIDTHAKTHTLAIIDTKSPKRPSPTNGSADTRANPIPSTPRTQHEPP